METSIASLSKMKVADLKKELKVRDLAITGNKNELVERLHEALTAVEEEEEEVMEAEDTIDTETVEPVKVTPTSKRPAPTSSANGVAKKVALSPENVTKDAEPVADDPLAARAKRFGEVCSETAKKAIRADRFGPVSTLAGPGTDLEKLRLRAERFGEVTSKSLTNLELEDKKKARMERFGISGDQEKKSSDEETKAARAAKFGTGDLDNIVIKEKTPATTDESPVEVVAAPASKATPVAKVASVTKSAPAKEATATPKRNRTQIVF